MSRQNPSRKSVSERDSRVALPDRYASDWREPFDQAIAARMAPGAVILDIGSGRNPSVEARRRPPGSHYVGLDLSEHELSAAGEDAYDEHIVVDASVRRDDLLNRFDLAVSWQVLEHVRKLDVAVENFYDYLRPGGTLVSLFSGSWSAFGVINRVLPDAIGKGAVARIMHRSADEHPVFPAFYDKCHDSALQRIFASWSSAQITPLYRGATYFHFSKNLSRLYLSYENAVAERGKRNLATHYLVVATR